jgi:broad specificity phosphatase PhoE
MPTVLLVRHGRTTANAAGVLPGWTPGIHLDGRGRRQAGALARRLAPLPLVCVVTSPLERCRQTAELLLSAALVPSAQSAGSARSGPAPRAVPAPAAAPGLDDGSSCLPGGRPAGSAPVVVDDRLGECRYGDWTGRRLRDLRGDPLWPVIQAHPSAAVFPGPEGESLRDLQHRAVSAIRDHDARVHGSHGPNALWMAVTHGDVIKAVLADALGLHLDGFQRLVVDPCSVSAVRYTPLRPFVLKINDTGEDLSGLRPESRDGHSALSSEAVVGGGAGPGVPQSLGEILPPPSDGPDAAGRRATP